jgi:hypothetical protein
MMLHVKGQSGHYGAAARVAGALTTATTVRMQVWSVVDLGALRSPICHPSVLGLHPHGKKGSLRFSWDWLGSLCTGIINKAQNTTW